MDMIFIFSGLISLASLICFFLILSNVLVIKKKLTPNSNQLLLSFNKAEAFGDYDLARDLLKELIWEDIVAINNEFAGDVRNYKYAYLRDKKWGESLEKYKLEFPNIEIAIKS